MPIMISQISRERSQSLSSLKSSFISTISHELRTPLTKILLSAELLERYSRKLSEDKKQEHIQKIKDAAKEMKELLNSTEVAEQLAEVANEIPELV